MAAASHSITQSISTPSGVNATFWILGKANIDPLKLKIAIVLYGYYSSAAQSNGNDSLDVREYLISGSAVATIGAAGFGNFNTAILNWVVANQPEFSSGTVA